MRFFDKKHCYGISAKQKEEKINNNTKNDLLNDAELLAYMATDVTHLCAANGRHYWYYVFEDIKECDFVIYLFNRNGLYPTLHYSHYLHDYRLKPVLRMRSKFINKNSYAQTFISLIQANRTILQHEKNHIHNNLVLAMNDFSKSGR